MIPTNGSQPSGRAKPKVAVHSHDGEQRQQTKTTWMNAALVEFTGAAFSSVRRTILYAYVPIFHREKDVLRFPTQ